MSRNLPNSTCLCYKSGVLMLLYLEPRTLNYILLTFYSHMLTQRKINTYLALAIVVALSVFFGIQMFAYLTPILLAAIFYVFFLPLYKRFRKKRNLNKTVVGILTIFVSIFAVLIPISGITIVVYYQTTDIIDNIDDWSVDVASIRNYFPDETLDKFSEFIESQIENIAKMVQSIITSAVSHLGHFIVDIFIFLFVFFYLLVNHKKVDKQGRELIPFNKENTEIIINQFRTVTKSAILTSGVLAILQGTVLGIGFAIIGIPGAAFWGFLTGIVSFLPVIGTPFVWVPMAVYQIIVGNYWMAGGVLIIGIIVATIDDVIRPYVQNKTGGIHPLIALFGIFIGLSVFGLPGLILGPLLLVYLLLMVKMFREEYVLGRGKESPEEAGE